MEPTNIVGDFVNVLNSFITSNFNNINNVNSTESENYLIDSGSEVIPTLYTDNVDWKSKVTDPIFEEIDENVKSYEKIEAVRYVIEYYIKIKNKDSLVRWFAYFLPNEKIEIRIRAYNNYLSTDGKNYLCITKANYPKNLFKSNSTNGKIYESKLEKVFLNKKWVDQCLLYDELNQKIKQLNIDLFINAPQDKTTHDKISDVFELGMLCFESNNYSKGIEEFLRCIEMLEKAKSKGYVNNKYDDSTYYLCYYNIACCYARTHDKTNTIEWLKKSFEKGYTNWSHAISDKDMRILLDNEEFINLIREMKIKNPNRDVQSDGVIKSINIIDIFLKKNNI